jgi:hypothetical protein
LDGVPLRPNTAVRAPTFRQQPAAGFARVPSTNYPTAGALAAAVAAAASAYSWPAFVLVVELAGGPGPVSLNMAGGQGTLYTLAALLQQALAVALAPVTPSITVQVKGTGGLVFASTSSPAFAFSITFPLVPVDVGPRMGYAAGLHTGFAVQHDPTGHGWHLPEWCEGVLATTDLRADVTPAGELTLTPTPFQPFQVTVVAAAGGALGAWTATRSVPTFMVGLQPGAIVMLAGPGPGFSQTPCVVAGTDVDAGTLALQQLDATVVPPGVTTGTCTVVPLGSLGSLVAPCCPLVLYMQTAGALVNRVAPVPAVVFGFQPDTYTAGASGVLISPGTIRAKCDPYVLLCLSFHATDISALTGDVYYPLEVPSGGSQLVFAQVLRCNADFRTDYDRVFSHAFPGAGIHLGYIRVRLLNADGTPYNTHGHPVTVCLRMDVVGDGLSIGGPSHMTLLPPGC